MLTKALLAVILGLIIATGWLAFESHDRSLQLKTADAVHKADQQTIAGYASSDTTNQATIATLLHKLDVAAGVTQHTQQAADEAQATAAANAHARDIALAKAHQLQGELYARDHESAVWGAGHLSDGLSVQLRATWHRAAADDPQHDSAGCAAGAVCGDSGLTAGPPSLGTAAAARLPCSDGCYSNAQLYSLLDDALDSRGRCLDQLDAIGRLSAAAVTASTPPATKE
ncbi:MAG: hypothetical protein V4641_05690 [Pseudomonadota bacterium]